MKSSERRYLLWLIGRNERDGVYYGSSREFWQRSFGIKKRLLGGEEVGSYCPQCGVEHRVEEFGTFCSDDCRNRFAIR
jgi:hypothetical protein